MAEAEGTPNGEDRKEKIAALRKKLIAKAFNGAVQINGEKLNHNEMKAFLGRMHQMAQLDPEHAAILKEVIETPEGTARGIMALNARMQAKGSDTRYRDECATRNADPEKEKDKQKPKASSSKKPKPPTIH